MHYRIIEHAVEEFVDESIEHVDWVYYEEKGLATAWRPDSKLSTCTMR